MTNLIIRPIAPMQNATLGGEYFIVSFKEL